MAYLPAALWTLWVFLVGLGVGSFLNVLIARLPYEKSPVWPGSRCFSCLRRLKWYDNLPVIGYLTLGGRCRFCGAPFSARYLWVEVGTALAFVGLFWVEIMSHADGLGLTPWYYAPGLRFNYLALAGSPPLKLWLYFALHACLLSLLIAAAVIDAGYRIIPHQLTYFGTFVGLVASAVLPWPWPTVDPAVIEQIPRDIRWIFPESLTRIPVGLTLWPYWIPPEWAPPGSWQLGLLNGLVGAAAGTFLVRGFKFLFEVGFGQEALGLGDADLLMMAGAFLGWPVVVLGFFAGAVVSVLTVVPLKGFDWWRGRAVERELSFGPGLAVGVVLVWVGWPWAAVYVQRLYDLYVLGFAAVFMGGGLLVAGLLLRRKPATG
jgi:leader peptidase (prepilin peptidase)/N-methyltransferase